MRHCPFPEILAYEIRTRQGGLTSGGLQRGGTRCQGGNSVSGGELERQAEGDSHQIWRIQIIQVIAIDIHGTKGGKRQVRPHESPGFVSD
jgi:hypothetical protein